MSLDLLRAHLRINGPSYRFFRSNKIQTCSPDLLREASLWHLHSSRNQMDCKLINLCHLCSLLLQLENQLCRNQDPDQAKLYPTRWLFTGVVRVHFNVVYLAGCVLQAIHWFSNEGGLHDYATWIY